jgi:hypothetical protein
MPGKYSTPELYHWPPGGSLFFKAETPPPCYIETFSLLWARERRDFKVEL